LPDELTRQRTRPRLSRERIVLTALAIVDADGLERLTMRRLAKDLHVTTMAVYHHFPNKSALYDGIVEAVMAEIDVSVDEPSAPFRVRLKTAARAYRDVLVAHPNALGVLVARGPRTPGSLVPVETLLGIFRDAGFSPADAMAGMDVTAAMVRGAALVVLEQRPDPSAETTNIVAEDLAATLPTDRFPHLLEALASGSLYDLIDEFEIGLETLVRGFEARLDDARRQSARSGGSPAEGGPIA
jgi:AcrR family transcriptional regulator